MTTTKTTWIRVSKNDPCVVCRKPDWCTFTDDGTIACCMRVESNHPTKNGGWLHKLDEPVDRLKIARRQQEPTVTIDAPSIIGGWLSKTSQDDITAFASSLGVSAVSLNALGCARAVQHAAWAFPMVDGQGNAIGIRLRGDNGDKWAVKGSKSGIFVPKTIPQDVAMICEGPTDTAAAVSLGYFAIGRPSCNQGGEQISTTCIRLGIRRLVIVSDNDGPGLRGAKEFAWKSKLLTKILILPTKDIREFVKLGGTRVSIESQLQNLLWKLQG